MCITCLKAFCRMFVTLFPLVCQEVSWNYPSLLMLNNYNLSPTFSPDVAPLPVQLNLQYKLNYNLYTYTFCSKPASFSGLSLYFLHSGHCFNNKSAGSSFSSFQSLNTACIHSTTPWQPITLLLANLSTQIPLLQYEK